MEHKGAIACGHQQTAEAAADILSQGGNAFDAVIAAHLAACVAEPILSSLGGGGFLAAHTISGKNIIYDFFTHTPQNKRPLEDIDFYPITADFGETTQEFHIGMGSIAVPGSIRGLFEIHRDLGSLPLSIIAEPAIRFAREGVIVNPFQAYILDIIKPIYQHDETCYNLYKSTNPASNSDKQLLQSGERLVQTELADTIEALVKEGEQIFYQGEIASSVVKACKENGGLLTHTDFEQYSVLKREPLSLKYRDHNIYTNPPPSSGGILIAFALSLLESVDTSKIENQSAQYYELLGQVMKLTSKARVESEVKFPSNIGQHILEPEFLKTYRQQLAGEFAFNRGTTQFSVIDKLGNVASLTTSNGEGSSYCIPGTGIVLNNMLGEEDLNPGGFNRWKENQRISSMMAPTIVMKDNGDIYSIGSGGSNRIRSAILQVLIQLVDFNATLEDAIECPRIHLENDLLNVETGIMEKFKHDAFKHLGEVKEWNSKNLFFGGVHGVHLSRTLLEGKGDPRRGGVSIIL